MATVTALLSRWSGGDRAAFDELTPLIHSELRRLAAAYLRGRQGQTLQATALVNEAWIKLAAQHSLGLENRHAFFALAASAMRSILTSHFRARKSEKRGGGISAQPINEVILAGEERGRDVLKLDDCLTALAQLDPRKAKIVEMRFFAGMTAEEIAANLGVSLATMWRELRSAQAWLAKEMNPMQMNSGGSR